MIDTAMLPPPVHEKPQSPAARSGFDDDAFLQALTSGGDSRLTLGQPDRVSKYLCPPVPAPNLIVASSCTASPISIPGFRRAADFHRTLSAAAPRQQPDLLTRCRHDITARLLQYFGATGLAEAILCPSGTDALLAATVLMALERPGKPMTAILPQASETGSGVPRAATLCRFDGPAASDIPLIDCVMNAIAVPLRAPDGQPRSDAEIARAYAAAAASVKSRPVVFLTHGTKTGLIAPATEPKSADVIVDACQARIEPASVVRYLQKGWPVVVTGSKFFGGPAFSGAVLFPAARLSLLPPEASSQGLKLCGVDGNLGMLLRWLAALETMDAFAALTAGGQQAAVQQQLRHRAAAIERGLHANPSLVPMGGLSRGGPGWSDIPTIFSFAVRDPGDPQRLLSATNLRPLYHRLAADRILLGQPVELGRVGGLRIAIGARDLLPDAPRDGNLPRLFEALQAAASQR